MFFALFAQVSLPPSGEAEEGEEREPQQPWKKELLLPPTTRERERENGWKTLQMKKFSLSPPSAVAFVCHLLLLLRRRHFFTKKEEEGKLLPSPDPFQLHQKRAAERGKKKKDRISLLLLISLFPSAGGSLLLILFPRGFA